MEDISLHILDIAENSVAAGATSVSMEIHEQTAENLLQLVIEDNGRGMTEDFVKNILDPFCTTRTTRRVGLGLSLLAQSARETGGDISIASVLEKGTTVSARFMPGHIDMKPLGNIAETIITLIAGNPDIRFFFSYAKDGEKYWFDTDEIRAELQDVPINTPEVLSAIKNDIMEGVNDIRNRTSFLNL